jgi:thioesterase domain-containing protein/acyl carrier protein
MLKDYLHDQVARVLGIAPDKLEDDRSFANLGLDSLMAIELITRLETGLQISIPAMMIWQHPSVAQLTDHIAQKLDMTVDTRTPSRPDRESDAPRHPSVEQMEAEPETPLAGLPAVPDWSVGPLVEIQAHGGERPFFCVTAGYGDLFMFSGLASRIGREVPFYLLQPPQRNGAMAFPDVETLTACFIREIRAIQPEGPYRIGGYSAGGLSAFEVAQQLQRHGHAVEHLILMDVPCGYSRMGFAIYRTLQRTISTCFPRISSASSRTLRILHALFIDEGLTELSRMFRKYKPAHFAGHLVLLQARWSHLRLTRARYLWKKRAGQGLDVCIVPGTHDSFLRAHAKTAAEFLKTYL